MDVIQLKTVLGCVLLSGLLLLTACGGGVEGLYVARTENGLNLKMKRYRPSPGDPYRTGTPVLLLPGFSVSIPPARRFWPMNG